MKQKRKRRLKRSSDGIGLYLGRPQTCLFLDSTLHRVAIGNVLTFPFGGDNFSCRLPSEARPTALFDYSVSTRPDHVKIRPHHRTPDGASRLGDLQTQTWRRKNQVNSVMFGGATKKRHPEEFLQVSAASVVMILGMAASDAAWRGETVFVTC